MEQYARVRTAINESGHPNEINNLLNAGWEIITAQFCQIEHIAEGGRRKIEYVPHALMGLPKELATQQDAEHLEATTWKNGVPPEAITVAPAPAPVPAPVPQPVMSRTPAPAAATPEQKLFTPGNPDVSSLEVVGVRRQSE